MGFKNFIHKEKRSKTTLPEDERSYVNKIVDRALELYSTNMTRDPTNLAELAMKSVMDDEFEEIRKKLTNAFLYAEDSVKEKCPRLELNTNINTME